MTATAEAPVCTCIKGHTYRGSYLVVLDPYCQHLPHKEAATFAIEPYYPGVERPDSQAA